MFMGRFEHSIDVKGRLSIPSRFRETLNERFDSRLVITVYGACLLAYPFSQWLALEEKVASLPEFNKDTRAFLRFFYSSAADCTIDKLGRILIPQTQRDHAKLEKDVMLVGVHKHIEIWSKTLWEEELLKHTQEEITNNLERLGI